MLTSVHSLQSDHVQRIFLYNHISVFPDGKNLLRRAVVASVEFFHPVHVEDADFRTFVEADLISGKFNTAIPEIKCLIQQLPSRSIVDQEAKIS